MKIPTKHDWGDYKNDLDVKYAFKLYGGKSIEESMDYFINSPIERSSELEFAPFEIYKYYVNCFINYLMSENSADESDMASVFLRLARTMSEKWPNEFSRFYPRIEDAINFVADKQDFYDADYDIYGSFQDIKSDILRNLKKEK